MSQTLAVTGRGGTGKTSFVALASRFLDTPLLIDADPDQSLASMLGVDLEGEEIRTISQMLHDVQKDKVLDEFKSMPLQDKMEYLLHMSCLYEGQGFDLLSLGVKWTKGCYCQPNNLLRGLIPDLAKSYDFTVVDAPAGLEHLNRRVVDSVDHVFAVMDPSSKSIRNVERMRDISDEVGIDLKHIHLVANHSFSDDMLGPLRDVDGAEFAGQVAYDEDLVEYDWGGRSLRELPDESPACSSVETILQNAGCAATAQA